MKNLGRSFLSLGMALMTMFNCVSVVNCSAFGNNKNCDKIVNGMNENFNRTLGMLNEEINGYKRKIEDLENARDEALNKLNHCEKDPICKNALECANGNMRLCKYYEQNIKDLKKDLNEALNKLNYCEGIKDEKNNREIKDLAKITFTILAAHLAVPWLRNLRGHIQANF